LSTNVPFVDLRPLHDRMADDLSAAIERVRKNSFYILGEQCERFENEFAEYHGIRHAIGVGNGFDALALAVRGLGLGTGDEVIVCAHSFVASVSAIVLSGAQPVFVDSLPNQLTIDPERVASAISPRTRAILIVHLYGLLNPMEDVLSLAQKHDLFVIEDVAQAHGASLSGQKAGTIGTVGCFSFYPTKNLGALGDGGAIITRDDRLAERLRLLRNYGSNEKYKHDIVGVNSRLDELQASILRTKLPRLDSWNAERRQIAEQYVRALEGFVSLPSRPRTSERGRDHVHHLFVIQTEDRDLVRERMKGLGVETAVHYPVPVHLQPAFASLGVKAGTFPHAEKAASELISLPLFIGMTEAQRDHVIDVVKSSLPCGNATGTA